MTSIPYSCKTCIKFRKECSNGVMEEGAEWDGRDGGCTHWMGSICADCRNKEDTTNERMFSSVCKRKYVNRCYDGQCGDYAPIVKQSTLEGF